MKSLTMLLIGAGVGAALGMIFAPRSGEEMRNNVADTVNRGVDYGKQKTQEWGQKAGQQARKIASDVRDQVSDVAQEGARQYREAKSSYPTAVTSRSRVPASRSSLR